MLELVIACLLSCGAIQTDDPNAIVQMDKIDEDTIEVVVKENDGTLKRNIIALDDLQD